MICITTDDNDYKLIFDKRKSIFSNNIICSIKVKDILDRNIVTIESTLDNMVNFMDNILSFVELEEDIIYNLNTHVIGLSIEIDNNKYKIVSSKSKDYIKTNFDQYITIYTLSMIPVIKFKVTYTLDSILNCILSEFLDTYIE